MMELYIDDRKTNRKITFFNDISFSLRYDSVASSYSFSFYYDPQNSEHRMFAAVGQYQLMRLVYNGELLMTGFILSQAFNKNTKIEMAQFSGYSVPGVLEDSQIPPTAYPLQSDGLSLRQIAQKLLTPFQIRMDVDPSVSNLMDQVFEKTTAGATDTVKDYLCSLANQKDIVVSHTAKGHLLFTRAMTEQEPVLHFEKGVIGTSYSLVFDGQGMHSQITVMKQADDEGGNAGQYTIKNPYVPESTTAFRPKVITQTSGTDINTQQAAEAELAAELKNIKLKIKTDRWLVNDKLLKPNSIITITDPELFLFEKVKLFIESVDYTGDTSVNTATLTCVLPEVYSGKIPTENIFVQQ